MGDAGIIILLLNANPSLDAMSYLMASMGVANF